MKNFTYLFGMSSALISILGALFKKMHWPGGGLLLTVGIALVVLVFLPLYFIINYREQSEKKNPVYAIVGYFTIALLLAGALFKNMHWPGANRLVEGGIGFLILGFIPLYVVNVFQRSGKEKIGLPYVVMLLVGISIIIVFTNVYMSKNLLNIYLENALSNEESVAQVQKRTAHLLDLSHDSTYVDKNHVVSKIHDQARELQVMITEMQEGLMDFVNQPGSSINEVKGKDNRGAGRAAILEDGNGKAFVLEAKKFREMLMEYVNDPVTRNQIEDHLEFTSEVWFHEFGPRQIMNSPLMKNYYKNTDASKGIALSEYVAISYLLHHEYSNL